MDIQAEPKPAEALADPGIGQSEFIVLIAAMTSIVAFSIDSMLPALPAISQTFALEDPNARQLVIIAFVVSFGVSQIFFGPLSDALGRRPVMIGGLLLFAAASLAASFTDSFGALLVARAVQGIGASAVRIVANAVVRDCYSGREMARIMSFVFTVFIIVPILAPAVGQGIVTFAEWHWLFVVLGVTSLLLCIWYLTRMGETLLPHFRRPLRARPVIAAFREILSNRLALGYTLAVTLFFGALFSFIVSIQQIIDTIYGLQDWFAGIFAINAAAIGLSSLLNANLVRKFGMRVISHASLISFTVFGGLMLVMALVVDNPPVWVVMAFISIIMMSFGFVAGNFNAIAMEPLGHVAGSASSVLGMISFTGGALLGALTGQAFNGTVVPLAAAYFLLGLGGILIVLVTERGKLFGS